MTTEVKNIYRGKEFRFCDELMALQQGLTEDFLRTFPDFDKIPDTPGTIPDRFSGYKHVSLQYDIDNMPGANHDMLKFDRSLCTPENFPTAFNHIFPNYDGVTICGYGLMYPHSVISRHTGIENRTGEWIRVHIPLIIPKGDLGMEVNGEIVDWSDLFAFNNQRLHSVWNFTDEYRLILLVDMLRTCCDLPPGIPFKEGDDCESIECPPFLKTEQGNYREYLKSIGRS